MATEYRYPDEDAPTASWLPSGCPLLEGSSQADDDGVTRGLAAGGRMVAYQIADPTYFITHAFKIPKADMDAFRTFRDAVLGREFRMRDDWIGAFITVRIWEYSREWRPVRSGNGAVDRVEGTIVLRKVVTS